MSSPPDMNLVTEIFQRISGIYKSVVENKEIRKRNNSIKIEILVPDFRGSGKIEKALDILFEQPPNVLNHNLETIPRLYKRARPGARYKHSLLLLKNFKKKMPFIKFKGFVGNSTTCV